MLHNAQRSYCAGRLFDLLSTMSALTLTKSTSSVNQNKKIITIMFWRPWFFVEKTLYEILGKVAAVLKTLLVERVIHRHYVFVRLQHQHRCHYWYHHHNQDHHQYHHQQINEKFNSTCWWVSPRKGESPARKKMLISLSMSSMTVECWVFVKLWSWR